jgi:hypothetical protein
MFCYNIIPNKLEKTEPRYILNIKHHNPSNPDTTENHETASSTSSLDIYLNGQLSTRLYDKRDDVNFTIINCPHLDSNIPTALAYGVYISQLMQYARASSLYSDFLFTSPSSQY